LLSDSLDRLTDQWFAARLRPAPRSLRLPDSAAMLIISADHFTDLQTMLTADQSERLLRQTAERIAAVIQSLGGQVARSGHDQFRVFVPGIDLAGTQTLAQALRARLSEPFDLEGRTLLTTFSVGAALSPDQGERANTLSRSAHVALQNVRRSGSSGQQVFDATVFARERGYRELEQDLRQLFAVGDMSQFEVLFQPLVSCKDNSCVGGEALLRWNHPVRGTVPTDRFIDLAEQTGIIEPLGLWILKQACRAAAGWPEPWRVHVNLSVGQLLSAQLVDDVLAVLDLTGLAPQRLGLEITETLFIHHYDSHVHKLVPLRERGIQLVLDDFGTGCSSLNHLRNLPLDWLKLDTMFAHGVATDARARALVEAVLAMSRVLGLVLVVEGVEDEAQRTILRDMGCDVMQGYLLGRPMLESELLRLASMS
jgi:predicted signal transduction protein with EAL and GGDEF domain